MTPASEKVFNYLEQRELSLCVLMNKRCRRRAVQSFFGTVSRLGDGVAWYSLMAVFPIVDGYYGLKASLHMGIAALLCLGIYKWLKPRTMRHRPYLKHQDIKLSTAPLDYYSFPSGHTLHAVAFTCVALAYYPVLAWLLLPFTLLVAVSRVVLGLHYPSDVLVGALIGAAIAWLSFLTMVY